jgi:hypothetical protein
VAAQTDLTVLKDVTTTDLIVCFLHVLEDAEALHILHLFVSMNKPVPFAYNVASNDLHMQKQIMFASLLPLIDWKKPIIVSAGVGKVDGKSTLLNGVIATSFQVRSASALHAGLWEISISPPSGSRPFHVIDMHEDIAASAAASLFLRVLADIMGRNLIVILHFTYPKGRDKAGALDISGVIVHLRCPVVLIERDCHGAQPEALSQLQSESCYTRRIPRKVATALATNKPGDKARFVEWAVELRGLLSTLVGGSTQRPARTSLELEHTMSRAFERCDIGIARISSQIRSDYYERVVRLLAGLHLSVDHKSGDKVVTRLHEEASVRAVLPFTMLFLEKWKLEVSLQRATEAQFSMIQAKVINIAEQHNVTTFHPIAEALIEVLRCDDELLLADFTSLISEWKRPVLSFYKGRYEEALERYSRERKQAEEAASTGAPVHDSKRVQRALKQLRRVEAVTEQLDLTVEHFLREIFYATQSKRDLDR